MKNIFLSAIFFLGFGSALAQSPPSYRPPGGGGGIQTIQSLSGSGPVLNILSYGDSNSCNGSEDDAAAINAAAAVARAYVGVGNLYSSGEIFIPFGMKCTIKTTVNMEGFTKSGVSIIGGAVFCETNGQPCFDALGSRFLHWQFSMSSGTGLTPNDGIEIGRLTTNSADNNVFNHMQIDGYFTRSAIYNFASEDSHYDGLYAYNRYSSAGAYNLIFDGCNVENISSQFGTVTIPQNTCVSFNSNLITGGSYLNAAGPAVLAVGTSRLKFDNTYLANVSGGELIDLCTINTLNNESAFFDIHSETSPTYTFDLTCPSGVPQSANETFSGLTYKDFKAEPTSAVFGVSSTVTGISAQGLDVNVTSWYPSNDSPVLFGSLAKWTSVSGNFLLPVQANYNDPPNGLSAGNILCFVATGCTTILPTQALNRNPDFLVDQPNANTATTPSAASQIVVDGWHVKNAGFTVSDFSFIDTDAALFPGYTNYEEISTAATQSTSANWFYNIRTIVEAPDITSWVWGTASAKTISEDFCAYSIGISGTFATVNQNSSVNQSFVTEHNITAGVVTCYHDVIPGDTGGSWASLPNRPGLLVSVALTAPGSTYQTTAGAWQSGEYYGTSADWNMAGTAGAHLYFTAFHVYQSPFKLPYVPRSFAQELQLSQHWFRKSIPYYTQWPGYSQIAANGGTAGAATVFAPAAFGVSSTSAPVTISGGGMYSNTTGVTETYPTLLTASTAVNSSSLCYDKTQSSAAGAVSVISEGDAGFSATCTLVSGDAAYDQLQFQWALDSGF